MRKTLSGESWRLFALAELWRPQRYHFNFFSFFFVPQSGQTLSRLFFFGGRLQNEWICTSPVGSWIPFLLVYIFAFGSSEVWFEKVRGSCDFWKDVICAHPMLGLLALCVLMPCVSTPLFPLFEIERRSGGFLISWNPFIPEQRRALYEEAQVWADGYLIDRERCKNVGWWWLDVVL